ncbi:MAG: hydroxyethylthiazole kinase [Pseudorhodoplanes sp.]
MRAPPGDLSDNAGLLAGDELAGLAADLIERIRVRRPRVHCITNAVAQAFTANVLLAAGAIPSMTISPDEVSAFAARADALLVNLGTFDAERRSATEAALAQVAKEQKPWVLDPVLIDRSPPRAIYARELVTRRPPAVRLNEAEFVTLAEAVPPEVFARRHSAVVALTGASDVVTDGTRIVRIGNGHPMMARVTAMGCAASALVAAALAVETDAFKAVASALLIFGIAGDMAGDAANGPGSFGVTILDALFNLDRATIVARAKVSS